MSKFDYREYIKNNKFTISKAPEQRMINERFFMGGLVSTKPINGNPFGTTSSVNENKLADIKSKCGTPPKGADIRERNGAVYVYYAGNNAQAKKWAMSVKEKCGKGVSFVNTTKNESKESVNEKVERFVDVASASRKGKKPNGFAIFVRSSGNPVQELDKVYNTKEEAEKALAKMK